MACAHAVSHGTASQASPSSRRAPGLDAIVGDYDVIWEPASGSLKIEARLSSVAGARLAVEPGAEPFAKDVEASADGEGERWRPVGRRAREFDAAPCAAGPCRLRYRYALREAARQLDALDAASEESDFLEAPPSTWLLVPTGVEATNARVRFRVKVPEGSRFVTGVFPSFDASGAWDITLDDLATSPYSAFGSLRVREMPLVGSTLQLAIGAGQARISDDKIADWAAGAARAITMYYGGFPLPHALILVSIGRGHWVGSGHTLAGGGGTVFLRVGEDAPPKAFQEDWVLVHEMVHLTFPSVAREHDWLEEGVATYVEPFARVRAGLLDEKGAWGGFAKGIPNGLPKPGDRGLDHTHTWGRVYWGGALFWWLADIEIRKRTNNRFGLEHALRGLNTAGATNAKRWPIDEVLKVGDEATQTTVLRELYASMGASPHPVDIELLLKQLGVQVAQDRVTFDDQAPLANIRRAITHGHD